MDGDVTTGLLRDLLPLADALFVRLRCDGRKLRGSANVRRALPLGPAVPFKLNIVSSFISDGGGQVGVLCVVRGDLMLFAHIEVGNHVTVSLLDAARYGVGYLDRLFEENKVSTLDRAVALVSKGAGGYADLVVATFVRDIKGAASAWQRVNRLAA
jgi:hypothetical protein